MTSDRKTEVLVLYLAYFATVAISLIPYLMVYAVGGLALQFLYAIIRYVSADSSENVFRSHALNYILAQAVSFVAVIALTIQAQAIAIEPLGLLLNLFSGSKPAVAAASFGYIAIMMAMEALVAIFWPIILIGRGLYLLNTGRPVFSAQTKAGIQDKVPSSHWLASAIMPNGAIVRFAIDGTSPQIVGRSRKEANIVIDDDSVSRRHARLESRDGSIWISDLGSENGTKVGGREIGFNPIRLHAADQVQLGLITLTISAA